ncbi:hypothetical protein SEA_VERITY_85 [Gordonia phage Verity]|uniref:Uncharacterized protein n=2 Tax=Zitchvirus TaxID=2948963 RepID=A0A514DIX5_9CAUD|nr:hypothetical protein J1775_gp86 [Gordonia phage Zipp]YP_010002923.1 hypothetical protein J1776_gp85 [Gordonia phage Verity]QPO16929.1 hypothetical protein SEA_DELREY21_86 [Gordonia phage Delrey21]QXN74212.1 hypothetical protein SEA_DOCTORFROGGO_86 [Gordonia phage DoctorFroggo]QDH93239.1 hypothetical protein SEA_ZIPP_86 [Gordonia phage Zipp]QDH93571.1 hypothetical protein SEA_VERITY_85 [Gordonia phage Verity]
MTMPTIWKRLPAPPSSERWCRDRLHVRPRRRRPYEYEAFVGAQSSVVWQLWFWDHGTTTGGMWRLLVEADDLFNVQVLVDQVATLSRQYHDLDKSQAIARAVHWLNWKTLTDTLADIARESAPARDARPPQSDSHGLFQQHIGRWSDGGGPWA